MIESRIFADMLSEFNIANKVLFEQKLIVDSNPFCISNYTDKQNYDISWSGKNPANTILFDEERSCIELLSAIRTERQYSFLLYDKSIIQAEYKVKDDEIIKGRLLFIKLQNKVWSMEEILEYADDPDLLDESLDEEIGFPTMIRIDFDPKNHTDCTHPKAHFVLSNIKDCRIPMKAVLSLGHFTYFILRQIYNFDIPELKRISFDPTITQKESSMIHINW